MQLSILVVHLISGYDFKIPEPIYYQCGVKISANNSASNYSSNFFTRNLFAAEDVNTHPITNTSALKMHASN